MAPPVAPELREQIVIRRYKLNMSIDNIAQLSGRSKRTVNYVLETYRNYGQVVNPFIRPQGRPRVLDQGNVNFIDSVLAEHLVPCVPRAVIMESLQMTLPDPPNWPLKSENQLRLNGRNQRS